MLLEEGLDVPKYWVIPGSYKVPILSEVKIIVDGLHDKISKISKGEAKLREVMVDESQELGAD